MKNGDIVMVSFTARDLTTGNVFDTTDEKAAKESGVFREGAIYRRIPVVVGAGNLIRGVDEKLAEMKPGEERVFEIGAEDAFGERKAELVRIIPLNEFRKQKINPCQGLPVEIGGIPGRVQTVSGGRVRVDFNHELAGRRVEYKVKVEMLLAKPQEQVDAFLERFFPFREGMQKPSAEIKEGVAEVKMPPNMPKELSPLKDAFSKTITENVKGVKGVRFVEDSGKKEHGKAQGTGRKPEAGRSGAGGTGKKPGAGRVGAEKGTAKAREGGFTTFKNFCLE